MTALPLIGDVTCDGCDACCRSIGVPPSWLPAYSGENWHGTCLGESEDYSFWLALPEHLHAELTAYYAAVGRGEIEDRAGTDCLWLDAERKRCRHYQYRPRICRDFQVGGEFCHAAREQHGS